MNKYYTFKRGSVVMVDFSPQIGSEIKGKHFAIVLTKKDRSNNELLTVIPLTSKNHKSHINFGENLYIDIYKKIINHMDGILDKLDEFEKHQEFIESNKISESDELKAFLNYTPEQLNNYYEQILDLNYYEQILDLKNLKIIEKNLNLYNKAAERYAKLKKITYGKPHQITTISKKRILKPINQYDPIRNLKVSDDVMNKIDDAIIKLFTK